MKRLSSAKKIKRMSEPALRKVTTGVVKTLTRNSLRTVVVVAAEHSDELSTKPHDVHTCVHESVVKDFNDLPGPQGLPILGTAHEYFRKGNRGQMHEVQVFVFINLLCNYYFLNTYQMNGLRGVV